MGNASKVQQCLGENWITVASAVALLLGVIVGILIRDYDESWTARDAMYLKFLGELFLRGLKAIIIPLVLPSLIVAIGTTSLQTAGIVGRWTIVYYLVTTFLAVFLGIAVVFAIEPGDRKNNLETSDAQTSNSMMADSFLDIIRNLVPPNIVQAATQTEATVLAPDPDLPKKEWTISHEWKDSGNMLGLISVSLIFAVATVFAPEKTVKPVIDVLNGITEVMMIVTKFIMNFTPLAVFFLVAGEISGMKDAKKTLESLGLYSLTVMLGLVIHSLIVLPSIFFFVTRRSPLKFIINLSRVLMTAFATASSSATLPITIETNEELNGIDKRITRMMLPIGATMNMDGTALYEAVAAIYLAQLRNLPLNFGHILGISLTATLASVGAAGIPQAGTVTMIMVLDIIGIPASDIGLILGIDWLLDRFRTTVNVLGDSIGAGIVQVVCGDSLDRSEGGAAEEKEIVENGRKVSIIGDRQQELSSSAKSSTTASTTRNIA